MSTALRSLVRDLGLQPHPEGGWFREIHRSPARLELERGVRSALTVIDYALEAGGCSRFHRVASEEVWSWCEGAPVELFLLDAGRGLERFELGPDRTQGQRRAVVVPAGCWQAAAPLEDPGGAGHAWCCCIVAPGFDFADFELAERAGLSAAFPEHADLIARLTGAPAG